MNNLGPRKAVLLSIVLLCAAAVPHAQELGYLQSGPDPASGLPFLRSNFIPHERALYRVGEAAVDVYLVTAPVPDGEGWDAENGGLVAFKEYPSGTVFRYRGTGWTVYLRFPAGYPAASAETFARSFASRFEFLVSLESTGGETPFPAVVLSPEG